MSAFPVWFMIFKQNVLYNMRYRSSTPGNMVIIISRFYWEEQLSWSWFPAVIAISLYSTEKTNSWVLPMCAGLIISNRSGKLLFEIRTNVCWTVISLCCTIKCYCFALCFSNRFEFIGPVVLEAEFIKSWIT